MQIGKGYIEKTLKQLMHAKFRKSQDYCVDITVEEKFSSLKYIIFALYQKISLHIR